MNYASYNGNRRLTRRPPISVSAGGRCGLPRFLSPRPTSPLPVLTAVGAPGGAGTGKSFLLQRIISALPPESTWVTASTGAAACQVQGVTLHSFAGLGRGAASREQCVQLASRPGVLQHWKRCKHLVIDEISMVDADFFQVGCC